MVLILDAMGGDFAPLVPVKAAKLALEEGLPLSLVGDLDQIRPYLKQEGIQESQLELHDCKEFITMEESINALSLKKKSSMRVAFQLLKEGKGSAVVSAGHSGAMLALGLLILKTLPGIERPCIAAMMPAKKGLVFLADAGANVDCEPNQLLQFGILASVYLECIFNIENPKIALLNIGSEEGKGNQLAKEAYLLFQKSGLHFTGNLEGKAFFESDNDIVITDGFAGNVLLKSVQGAVSYIKYQLKEEISKSLVSKVGAFFMRKALANLMEKANYANYGGAPLLGLQDLGVVCHGSSQPKAIKQALQFAQWAIEKNMKEKMIAKVKALQTEKN